MPMPWLMAALSGGLLTLSFPPFSYWPLAWIALVPLWAAVRRCPDAKTAANLGAVTGLVFYCSAMSWLTAVFHPAYMAAPFWALFSLWIALHAALLWKLAKRGVPDWVWILATAVVMTGIEYFRAEVWWLHNSWFALGYSQAACLPLFQACALIGLYGLSGLIAGANAALALAVERRWKPAAALLGIVVVLGAWGQSRLRMPETAGTPVAVAIVQDESYDLNTLTRLSRSEPRSQLLIWPEYSFTVSPGAETGFQKLLAKRLDGLPAVRVLPGAIFPDDMKNGREQNFAWVQSAGGALLGRYDKAHPIPFIETALHANPVPKTVDAPLGRLGIEICYDLDFADTSNALARQGARILVVPDLDPLEWGARQHRQHSAMSAARAVETGLWIARAASSGESQLVDPRGRVTASLPSGVSATLAGEARLRAPGTPYTAGGWLLAPICLALTIGSIGRILLAS